MTRRKIGLILAIVGFGLAAVGAFGLVSGLQAAKQTTLAVIQSEPSKPVPPPVFIGVLDNPTVALYAYDNLEDGASDAPAFLDVSRVTAHTADNPVTGSKADSLLIELPAVPERRPFTVLVLVETDRTITPGAPDDILGLQWMLVFADDKFVKSARRVGIDSITDEPSDHFNWRYKGLGDLAELEIYGPPGTKYYAVMISNGTYCSLTMP
ncbi:hypothetical protein [Phosphitispora sp. TUW77]|uniref:hypothetical protein n=1 Tax=Phosphitispora sp. TUW77 TaxID=3152361 RepID=UPI003AB80CD8